MADAGTKKTKPNVLAGVSLPRRKAADRTVSQPTEMQPAEQPVATAPEAAADSVAAVTPDNQQVPPSGSTNFKKKNESTTVQMNLKVPVAVRKTYHKLSAEYDISIKDLVTEAAELLQEKYGRV